MTIITAQFDLGLYSPASVIAAAHRFTGTHSVRIERAEAMAIVTLTPRSDSAPDVESDLSDAVLDESLRESVRARTRVLHDTLVQAAFTAVPVSQP